MERPPSTVVRPPGLEPVDREVDVAAALLDEAVPLIADAVEILERADLLDAQIGRRARGHAWIVDRAGLRHGLQRSSGRSRVGAHHVQAAECVDDHLCWT